MVNGIIQCDSFQVCRQHPYLKVARNMVQCHSRKAKLSQYCMHLYQALCVQ